MSYFITPRVTPLYHHYSNEPSICDAFDNSHVQYIRDTLHISLDQYLNPNLYTIRNMQNMRFFCCSVYFTRLYGRNPVSFAICATIVKVLDQEKVLIKQLLLKFMSQIL